MDVTTLVKLQASFRAARRIRKLTWSFDGALLVVPCEAISGDVYLWSGETGKVKSVINCIKLPISAEAAPNYGDIAYSTPTGGVVIADPDRTAGSHRQRLIELHSDAVTHVAWSPDGETLATASHDQTICLLSRRSKFDQIKRIQTTHDRHAAVRWSPSGRQIATCGSEYGVQLVQTETGRCLWVTDRSRRIDFLDVAWPPQGLSAIAVALSDGRIWLLDVSTGSKKFELEGHKAAVVSLSFSCDGRLLFSLGLDNVINIWRTDTYSLVGSVPSLVDDQKYFASLMAHPHKALLAAPSERPSEVSIFEFDSVQVINSAPATSTAHRTRAKVAFVGESEVGKTSLALRLTEGRYQPAQTTHGIQIQSISALTLRPDWPSDEWGTREVILWDLGGQRNYQLIHQLFLHDTTLAVILFDPTRRDVAYHDVEAWVNRLDRQLRGGISTKILVATKQEHDVGLIVRSDIDELQNRLGFASFVSTSAKLGTGIPELGAAILRSIDWTRLERITRPELFQIIRDKIESLRARGEVVVFVSDLVGQLEREYPTKVIDSRGRTDFGAVNVVVTQLSLQGLIAETKFSDAGRALVLDLGQIERYAGSLIVAAENNPREIPAIDEYAIGSLGEYPGIEAASRLPRVQEKVVLEAVVHMLLQNGICLRHEGLLLFPGKFRAMLESDAQIGESSDMDSVLEYFDFVGAVENIYASLVASLASGRRFGRLRLRPGKAEFVGGHESMHAVSCWDRGRGRAQLKIYTSKATPAADRDLFISYVEDHLSRQGVELPQARAQLRCRCGEVFTHETLEARIGAGKQEITCPRCETPHDISRTGREPGSVDTRVEAARIRFTAQQTTDAEIVRATQNMESFESVRRSKETELNILHLSDLHISGDSDPQSLLQPLAMDLTGRELKVQRLDYLVLSGDITNRAGVEEFDKALSFVSLLLQRFGLTAERCIIVPGNHDVSWEEEVYEWQSARRVGERRMIAGSYVSQGNGFLVAKEDRYPNRFRGFSEHFYHLLRQQEYPLDPLNQALVYAFPEDGIEFIGLNSAWQIDEYFPTRASVHSAALARALTAANGERDSTLKIAVLHHPVTGNEKIVDTSFMDLLRQAGVRLCLHGHVHESRSDLFSHLHEDRVHIVGAGSFHAPAGDRPESTPRLYNLINVNKKHGAIRVHTRARRTAEGAWEGWAVWPGPSREFKQGWYELALQR